MVRNGLSQKDIFDSGTGLNRTDVHSTKEGFCLVGWFSTKGEEMKPKLS